jgi:hypothetical protein
VDHVSDNRRLNFKPRTTRVLLVVVCRRLHGQNLFLEILYGYGTRVYIDMTGQAIPNEKLVLVVRSSCVRRPTHVGGPTVSASR